MKFNLTESGMIAVLPWLTMAFSAYAGGWIADSLVRKGVSVTVVRKVLLSSLVGFRLVGILKQFLPRISNGRKIASMYHHQLFSKNQIA